MNNSLLELYAYAENNNIEVISTHSRKVECLSVMDENGDCGIGINPFFLNSETDELIKLAHELGHCATGSFYNEHSPLDIRAKHERRANKWAIKKLIPEDELKEALTFCINRYELSEHFGVPEDFMQKALDYYKNFC